MSIAKEYATWKAETATKMENLINEIIADGTMIASVSYNKPGDDADKLWHIDTYDCEGKVYQIEYTDYVYIDLKLLGTSEIEEATVEEIQNVMTNRKLIDYCNSHWDKVHRCEECPYNRTYCDKFCRNYNETPFRLDKYFDGKYYTDEKIILAK